MTLPILLAFCSPADRERVRDASGSCPVAYWGDALGTTRDIILLAVGPQGGADLARWIGEHGLDWVRGIGLVGVAAPWAERVFCAREAKEGPAILKAAGRRLPLGPLEPLRAVAERARLCAPLCPSCRSERVRPDTDDCKHFICRCGHAFTPTPLRIVVACAPDDGVCATCGDGHGYRPVAMVGSEPLAGLRVRPEEVPKYVHLEPSRCDVCFGTGKALSSAQVASELVGVDVGSTTDSIASGGTWVDVYSSNVALADHGLRAILEHLTR